MPLDLEDEANEMLQEYIRAYSLNDGLPPRYKKQALFLLDTTRGLRRLKFPDRRAALAGWSKAERWLGEAKVFFPTEHEGYHSLLQHVTNSLATLRVQIDEKFSENGSAL